MIHLEKFFVLIFIAFSLLFATCRPKQEKTELTEKPALDNLDNRQFPGNQDEEQVIATVEKLLVAEGNHDFTALDSMVLKHANLGITRKEDSTWQNTVMTIKEYINSRNNRELIPYCEIINDYSIQVSEGHLASLIADNVVHQFGIAKSHEKNYFTLMKEGNNWKFLSISFTIVPIPDEKKKFDSNIFARSYAQAWGSNRPEFVAMYFANEGILQVNEEKPVTGRKEISKVVQNFMTRFPDMKMSFDSLAEKPGGTEFHWTLTGTDTDPKAKGHKVKFSGFERWTMSKKGLIQKSLNQFSKEEYNRQLESGSGD